MESTLFGHKENVKFDFLLLYLGMTVGVWCFFFFLIYIIIIIIIFF